MKFCVDDLVEEGLVRKKTYTEGPFSGLSVLKYTRTVFFGNLWNYDKRLLDCRGMVVDEENNIVIWPFTKIFNRFENLTDLEPDRIVDAARKINGFMAAVGIYNGEVLVSTTGTLDSDYAKLAKSCILSDVEKSGYQSFFTFLERLNGTLIFEICDESDPHIVAEEPGAYLIGCRLLESGLMLPEGALDGLAEAAGFKRPSHSLMKFSEVVDSVKSCTMEGYVLHDGCYPFDLLMKLKSPHYLVKKFLMRGGIKKWDLIWDNPTQALTKVEEEFYPLLEYLRVSFDKASWLNYDEQTRRKLIEEYYEG